MKKIGEFFKKYGLFILIIIVAVAAGAIILSSCSVKRASVDTKLTMSKDFEGVREMTVNIPQKTYEKYFAVSWGEVITLMKNECIDLLSCEATSSNSMYSLTFKLRFSSLEDYIAKAEAILGREVNISIDSPDNVFASGITINENFSSTELLAWLPNVFYEAGQISAESRSKILEDGQNVAEYDGKTYTDLSPYISISDLKMLTLNSIDIDTLVNADRTFNRKIIFDISSDAVSENGEAIRTYLESNVPEGVKSTWKKHSKNCVFTVEVKNQSIDELQSITAAVLDNENCMVNYIDSEATDVNILDVVLNFNEALYFDAFMPEGVYDIPVKYDFNIEDLYDVEVFVSKNGEEPQQIDVEALEDGGTLIDGNASSISAQVSMSRHYMVDHIYADTKVYGDDDVFRSFIFELSEIPSDFERDIINARFMSLDDEKDNIRNTRERNGKFCLTVNISGTESEISNKYNSIFGTNGDLVFKIDSEKGKKKFTFSENLDFSQYVPLTEDVELTYELSVEGYKFGEEQMKVVAPSIKNISNNGKKISCSVYGNSLRIEAAGTKAGIPIAAIVLVLLILAAIIAIVMFIKNKFSGIRRRRGGSDTSSRFETESSSNDYDDDDIGIE